MEFALEDKKRYASLFLGVVLLSLVIVILIMAGVPPVSRDALTHHLVLPKLFLAHGGIIEKRSVVFSYYPMNLDLLYVIPLYFKNDIAPKYIHFLFALLTAWFIYKYLLEYTGRVYGLLGALFFLSLPVIIKLSVTVYVDLGLVFFSWTCIYNFLKWFSNEYKARYLVYAALACGLALGTKYNGLLLLFIVAFMIPLVYSIITNSRLPSNNYGQRYRNSVKGILHGVMFILIALIIFSPWMIRNYSLRHNPIYPLYNGWFNPAESKSSINGLNPFQKRRYIYRESLFKTTLIPIRIFFEGRDDNPKYFDGKLNPYLLFLPILAFWKGKKRNILLNKHKKILVAFAVLYIIIALFTVDMRIRYVAPAIPPLVVLSVFGLKRLTDEISEQSSGAIFYKILIAVIILSAFFLNGKYILQQFRYIDPVVYLTGKVDRDTYITRFRGEYPAIQYANKYLPKNARVLCLLIGNRTYYLDRDFCLSSDFFHRDTSGKYSYEILLEHLNKTGATHIIFSLQTYRDWIKKSLSKPEMDIFEKFFKNNTKLLYQKYDFQVLEITSRAAQLNNATDNRGTSRTE